MSGLNAERLKKVLLAMDKAGLDAYLASTPITMGYLAGFQESGGERMLLMAIDKSGQIAMVVPQLSATHAAHTGIKDIRCWSDGEDPGTLFEQIAMEWGLKTAVIGIERCSELQERSWLRLENARNQKNWRR
jgi:Xaa-Pro aminopeptidase